MDKNLEDLPQNLRNNVSQLIKDAEGSKLIDKIEELDDFGLYELGTTLEEFGTAVLIDAHQRGIVDWEEMDTSWTLLDLNYDVDGPEGPFEFIGPITVEDAEEEERSINNLLAQLLSAKRSVAE